jgi:hypothetical protein
VPGRAGEGLDEDIGVAVEVRVAYTAFGGMCEAAGAAMRFWVQQGMFVRGVCFAGMLTLAPGQ